MIGGHAREIIRSIQVRTLEHLRALFLRRPEVAREIRPGIGVLLTSTHANGHTLKRPLAERD